MGFRIGAIVHNTYPNPEHTSYQQAQMSKMVLSRLNTALIPSVYACYLPLKLQSKLLSYQSRFIGVYQTAFLHPINQIELPFDGNSHLLNPQCVRID